MQQIRLLLVTVVKYCSRASGNSFILASNRLIACVRTGTPATCTRSYVCRSYRRGFHTLNATETRQVSCATSEYVDGDVWAFNGVT